MAGGFVVIAGASRHEECGWSNLWLRVLSLMGGLFLERTRQLIVHAGAIQTEAGAILFSGPSYVGKSTLALCAWQAGMTLLGDDRLLYHPGTAMVSAFPKPLKPRVDSVLPNDDSDGSRQFLGRLENEGHLVIPRSLAGMTPLDERVPVHRVFFLERSQSSSSDLRPLTAAEALPRWMNQMMLSQSHAVLSTLPALEQWAKAGRVHGLRIGVHDIPCGYDNLVEPTARCEVSQHESDGHGYRLCPSYAVRMMAKWGSRCSGTCLLSASGLPRLPTLMPSDEALMSGESV